jgi:uncharacterized protein (DUF736 family)
MSQYDNTNTGAAFLRDNANPKAPKWSGPINVNGKDLQIAIWEKTSKSGQPFLSLKIEEAREKNKDSDHNKAKSNGYQPQGNSDEDIPF